MERHNVTKLKRSHIIKNELMRKTIRNSWQHVAIQILFCQFEFVHSLNAKCHIQPINLSRQLQISCPVSNLKKVQLIRISYSENHCIGLLCEISYI